MNRRSLKMKPLAASIALSTMASATLAQNDAATGRELILEEVVVTAQRREQSLQEVPISVTAFSAETLQKNNITEARDYLSVAPNVGFSDDGGSGSRSINISIRGVSNVGLGEVSTANSIGFYIDELNVGSVSNGTINPQLQDMERIEVLRGPPGTYFGRNALGGALNISTKLPDEDFYAEVSANAGSFSTYGGEAIVNMPLSEQLMLRAVYSYQESDSFVDNINAEGNENGYEHNSGRVALRFLPNDRTTVDFSYTYTDEKEGGDISVPSGVLDQDTQSIFGSEFVAINELGFYPQNDNKVTRDLKERNENAFSISNLRVAYDFDNFTFKSITGLVRSDSDRDFDQDGTSLDVLRRFNEYSGDSFSQEFRLQSTVGEALDWTVGVFYADDEIEQFNSIQAGSEGSYTNPVTGEVIGLLPPIPAGFRINENNRVFKTKSKAVFGEVVWHLSEQWDITLGGRYTEDEINNRAFDVVAFEGAVPDAQGKETFDNFSPKFVAKYTPNDEFNVYASISQGYKAGGVDFARAGDVTNFDPEELTSYEVGFKSELADGRIRLSAAVFQLEWKDLQVQSNFLAVPGDISSAVEQTLNAAEASASGAEFELTTLIGEGLIASLAAGYLDTEFDKFDNALIKGNTTQIDLTGQSLPLTPELTATAALDYGFLVGGLDAFVRGEWSYRGEAASNLEAVASEAGLLSLPLFPYQVDAYDVVNLRAGVESEEWRFNAYIENVFEEDYYTGTGDGFGLSGIRIKPHPRVIGMKFTYIF